MNLTNQHPHFDTMYDGPSTRVVPATFTMRDMKIYEHLVRLGCLYIAHRMANKTEEVLVRDCNGY